MFHDLDWLVRGLTGAARAARLAALAGLILAAEGASVPGAAARQPAPALTVRVALGEPEVVMDYSTDSCRDAGGLDLPDVQARAFRRAADSAVVLVSGNAPMNYAMVGRDFDSLERDCEALLIAGDQPDAASFDNQEWILATYRDGRAVHALVHNEYHDPEAGNCMPGVSDTTNPCWYNAITYATSNDGGRTFVQDPAPAHVVAALPEPWDPAAAPRPGGPPPPHGYFTPSNIVRGPDNHFYSMFMSIPDPQAPSQGTCVMRTANLHDPASWRAWDGTGFNLAMGSPYGSDGEPAPTGRPPCTPVSQRAIAGLHGSLTYSSYLDRYVLVGSGTYNHEGRPTCGTYFSLSHDLVEWSAPQIILEGKLPYAPCNEGGSPDGSIIYPSLLDHESAALSYDVIGRTPHLYYVVWNQGLDRDLVRVPVTFTKPEPAFLPLAMAGVLEKEGPEPLPSPTPFDGRVERVAALLVDDGGSAEPRLPIETVRAVLDDVAGWYTEASFGRTAMQVDVRGWFEIAMTAGSSTDPRIYAAAVADGVRFREVDHVLVLFHGGSGFGSSLAVNNVQIEEGGDRYPLAATVSQVTRFRDTQGTRGVTVHELGHALGLPHANHLSQLSGAVVAYGTSTDTMGSSSSRGHFSAYYKHRLGWIDGADVVTATTSGVHTIAPLERPAGRRLLVVPIDGPGDPLGRLTLGNYVVEVRRAIGFDAALRFNVLDGALVSRLSPLGSADQESGARIQAVSIDASPETASVNSDDYALMPGRTLSDQRHDIHITVLSADDDGTTVQVERDTAGNSPPVLLAVRAEPHPSEDNAFTFTAEYEDPDQDPVSVFWNFEVVADPGGTGGRGLVTRYAPGTYAAGEVVAKAFREPTPRTVCAIVSDRKGGHATGCTDIFGATNVPPVVSAAVNTRGPATVQFELDIDDVEPTWVEWDFGDGSGASFVSPRHTYDPPGIYEAKVTVSDGQHTVVLDVPVDASQDANLPPVADAGSDQTTAPGELVRLDGSGSYDPDQYPNQLRFIWTAPGSIRLSDARAVRPTFVAPAAAGPYTFTLQVYDGAVYAADEVVVTVRSGALVWSPPW